jgi:hypothetical protein
MQEECDRSSYAIALVRVVISTANRHLHLSKLIAFIAADHQRVLTEQRSDDCLRIRLKFRIIWWQKANDNDLET